MKIQLFYISTFILTLALLINACSPSENTTAFNSDPIAYMPANPDFAMQLDFSEISSKMDFEALVNHETFRAFAEGDESGLMDIVNVLLMDGVDRGKNAISFGGSDDVMHLVAGISDASALTLALENKDIELKKVDGLNYANIGENTLVFNAQIMHYASAVLSEEGLMETAFPSETAGDLRSAEFEKFMSRKADARFWLDSDNMNDLLNMTGKVFTGFDGMDAGVFVTTSAGIVDLDIEFFNVDDEQQAMFDELFEAKTTLTEYVPANSPAFISMAVTAKMAAATEGSLGKMMVSGAEEILMVFEGIELSMAGGISVKPKLSFRMDAQSGQNADNLVSQLKDNGAVRAGGKINLLNYPAEYKAEGNSLTGSVTNGVDLRTKPEKAFSLTNDIPGFGTSPIKIYIDANAVASKMSMRPLADLEYIAIHLEKTKEGSTRLHLNARSDDPEKSGLNELSRVLMDIYPLLSQFGILN